MWKYKQMLDPVTREALCERYNHHKQYEMKNIEMDKRYGYKTRRHGLPEDISENIIKFVIRNKCGDKKVVWSLTGDLNSGKRLLECKSFISNGPISFGPDQKWDEIYFLDARDWLDNRLVIYLVCLPSEHSIWKNIKVSKTDSKSSQSNDGRRPRINWERLYPQIAEHCQKIFEGAFEDIFVESPRRVAQSGTLREQTPHCPPVCKDESLPAPEA